MLKFVKALAVSLMMLAAMGVFVSESSSVGATGTCIAKVFVANYSANSVSMIDTVTNTASSPISVGSSPNGVAITPDGTKAYVANYGGNNVSVLDIASNTAPTTISTGAGSLPEGIAITSDGATAYIATYGTNSVSVLDIASSTMTTAVGVGSHPVGIALTPCQAPTPPTTTTVATDPAVVPAFTG